MIAWVLYDIGKDKVRQQVAKYCKQAGLYRVQLSVFLGTLEKSELDALSMQIEDCIDAQKDRVYIFPMNKQELHQTVLLGQAFDKDLVSDDVQALFF
jgi:CRISPR-associated protein Cas2